MITSSLLNYGERNLAKVALRFPFPFSRLCHDHHHKPIDLCPKSKFKLTHYRKVKPLIHADER